MRWTRLGRDIEDLKRFETILTLLCQEGFHYIAHEIKNKLFFTTKKRKAQTKKHAREPERIRKLLEKLGPTFVKLGQLLSLRPDLVPKAYADEFKKLQDQVTPLPFNQIRTVIEAELGKPLKQLFRSVDTTPLSAASISQVHRVVFHNGKKAIIKVQRPRIAHTIQSDIDIMEYMARQLERNKDFANLRPTTIVEEFKAYTQKELDFRFELRSIKKFHTYFASWSSVQIPRGYQEYSTSKVLVMEYMQGDKLNTLLRKGSTPRTKKAAKILFRALMYQIFDLGAFHGDAHPANLLFTKKDRLVFLDFGIVGFLSPELQHTFLRLLFALMNKDVRRGAQCLLQISQIRDPSAIPAFKEDVEQYVAEWYGSSLHDMRFTVLIYKVLRSASKHDIQVPCQLVLVSKSLLTLEGTGILCDPQFNLVASAKPLLKKILLKHLTTQHLDEKLNTYALDLEALLEQLPERAEHLFEKLEQGKLDVHLEHKELEAWKTTLDRNAAKRSLSVLFGFLFLGSAYLATQETTPALFGVPLSTIGFGACGVVLLTLFTIFLKHRRLQKTC